MNIVFGILLFFLIIVIHEFGHFITAKAFKMNVKEFAIGMGPRILKKEYKGTVYCLKALPIGGSVMLDEDIETSDPNSFRNKPVWQRMIVIAAGAFMNFVLGFIFCICSVLCSDNIATTTVAGFQEGAISSNILQPDDKILKINDMSIFTTMDISFQLSNSDARSLDNQYYVYKFTVERNGEVITLDNVTFASRAYAQLIADYKKLKGDSSAYAEDLREYFTIGENTFTDKFKELELTDPDFAKGFSEITDKYKSDYASQDNNLYLDFKVYGEQKGFGNVISTAGATFISDARLVWISFINLLNGTYGLNDMSGPIGVVQSVSTVAAFGWESLLTLAALIAINVGIVNLFPIPAMDGARLVFLIIEAIRRKPIKAEHEGMVHFIGIIVLMLFMLIITFNDIVRLFTGGL